MPPDEHGQPRNEWGAPTEQDYGTAHVYPLAGASSVRDIEDYPWWPDPSLFDHASLAAEARRLGDTYAVRGPYWMPISNRVFELMGMETRQVGPIRTNEPFAMTLSPALAGIIYGRE